MKNKILIAVKTYPALSRRYAELVCTAGLNESGEWRRIYPVRFRSLLDDQKYKKFQWIEAEIEKSSTDKRPESYRITREDSLRVLGAPLSRSGKWIARREAFFDKLEYHDDLGAIIRQAHRNRLSLAAFSVTEWLDFTCEPVEREWNPRKLARLEVQRRQLDFFKDEATLANELSVVRKLPYKFSYRFRDVRGRSSKLMIEDWEIGALYWNCLKATRGDEKAAIGKVRQKYWDDFVMSKKYAPVLILGTTLEHHNKRSPNPFLITSVLAPPTDPQLRLFR